MFDGRRGHRLQAGGPAYVSARTQSWVKAKCLNAEEFVIIGYRPSDKKSRPFASLLIGEYDGGNLVYRGRVGTGFDDKMLRNLEKRFAALAIKEPAAANIPADIRRRAKWVKPELVAQIAYIERTPDGVLRHPSFEGLREDKPAREVKLRQPEPPPMPKPVPKKAPPKAATKAAKPATKAAKTSVAGSSIKLTHPDKIVYPDIDLTKRALFEYYEAAASWMLAHTKDRPASVVRCPDGTAKKCFFQKNHMPGFEAFGHVAVAESDGGTADYFTIKNELSILSGVQMGVFEFPHLGKPRRQDRGARSPRLRSRSGRGVAVCAGRAGRRPTFETFSMPRASRPFRWSPAARASTSWFQ